MRLPTGHPGLRVGLAVLLLMGCGVWACRAAAQHRGPLPPRCRQDSLSVTDGGYGGVAAGTVVEAIEFGSEQRCYLRGYPSIWLFSKAGRRIAIVHRIHGETYRPVILAKSRPTYADLQYENPYIRNKPCRLKAYYMGIEVPGGRQRIEVPFQTTPMRFCPGIVWVTGFGSFGPIEL